MQKRSLNLRLFGVCIGVVVVVIATVVWTQAAAAALVQTWPPFVLVAGLLLLGVVANADGIFAEAGAVLNRLPGSTGVLYVVAMSLTSVVTVLLNLDTSVAFLTPVLVFASRHRGVDENRLLYGCVFMSNSASLLLPGSNLTNLLVLGNVHLSGLLFIEQTIWPWIAAVMVTMVVVAMFFPERKAIDRRAQDGDGRAKSVRPLSILAIAAAIACILVLPNAALPVLALGVVMAAVRVVERKVVLRDIRDRVDFVTLFGVFIAAVTIGVLARSWSYPAHVMAHAGLVETAVIGAVASVLINNLPAAVLLGSSAPAHRIALLVGLNIGPNLAVTGSLSALIWWKSAQSVGTRPSARRYTAVGLVLVPLSLGAALVALHLAAY